MKRILFALAILAPLALATGAQAVGTPPFGGPVAHTVFAAAQTVTATGEVSDFFAPGDTVVFQAYAIDTKAHKLLTKKNSWTTRQYLKLSKKQRMAARFTLRHFFVQIPVAKGLTLTYSPPAKGVNDRYRWTASWKVPALYPLGVVHFQVFAQTWTGRRGSFSQLPISASQLTISSTPQEPFGPGPAISGSSSANLDVALFVDAVNGSHPANAPARPVGCTQTNVFTVGEQVVVRGYGYALDDGSVLSIDNVGDAHFAVAGQPDTILNWGSHGPTGAKVFYWTGAWNIPLDYPIGDVEIHVSYSTVAGKTGTLDYPITIIPQA
jgi:hypothetical protein